MYQVLVFYLPQNMERAGAVAARTKGTLRSAKFFRGVEEKAPRVIVDDAATEILAAYRATGVEVLTLSDAETDPEVIVDPEPEDGAASAMLPEGFEVRKTGNWWGVYDASGAKVGNSQHEKAEAVASALEVLNGG